MKAQILVLTGLTLLCGCIQSHRSGFTQVVSKHGITIAVPVKESEFRVSRPYPHVEIWMDDKVIFSDTTQNEYLFDDQEQWPSIRAFQNKQFEVLLKTFNAPDINRLLGVYFNDSGVLHLEEYPCFEVAPEDFDDDGVLEYRGIMHLVDAYDNPDSCYYNPELFYSITDQGLMLDSALTIDGLKNKWGNFYGFGSSDVVLPCPLK